MAKKRTPVPSVPAEDSDIQHEGVVPSDASEGEMLQPDQSESNAFQDEPPPEPMSGSTDETGDDEDDEAGAHAPPVRRQLKLSANEANRLKSMITEGVDASRSSNQARIEKNRRHWRMWRGLNVTGGSSKDGADFQYPMLKWITFGQLARIVAGVFGDDAEITARATSPVDEKDAKKAGHYMTWRFFEYMVALTPVVIWLFRATLFGRAHAEIIYKQKFYWQRDPATGKDTEVLCYDGPAIRPLWSHQVILPNQDGVLDDSDFQWKIIRDQVTPQALLDGERRDEFQGVKANWEKIVAQAQQRQTRDYAYDEEMLDVDQAEGVQRDNVLGNRDSLDVWRWYGKWRMLKGNQDATVNNLKRREDNESDVVITYLPGPQLIIGFEDARDLYPRMQKRDPLLSIAPVKDGSYWSPGLGELVESLQDESTINYKLFRKAGQLSIGPLVFFKPSSGFDPDTFEYKPGMAIPTEDPAGVKIFEFKANLTFSENMQQLLKSLAELVTGVSDQTLGRVSDRPNAPQTASGQAMLIQEGNTRVSLDINMLREDLGKVLTYLWMLDAEYADKEVFFRVTSEDAGALFDVSQGFGKMTSEERAHPFAFDLKFATSHFSKEAMKQQMLQIYGLTLQNPLVQQNPRALWVLLNRVWESFGMDSFADVIPEPPELEAPKKPKDEWLLMMKGEEVQVNPMDSDDVHLVDHRRRLEDEINREDSRRDPELEHLATQHIIDHERQKRQKMLLQAMAQAAMQQMQAQGLIPAPGQAGPPQAAGQPAAAPNPMAPAGNAAPGAGGQPQEAQQ